MGRATRKFFAEASRKRLPPWFWPTLLGGGFFLAFLAWLWWPRALSPQEWWAQAAEPALIRVHERAQRGDEEGALKELHPLIDAAASQGPVLGGRLAELRRLREEFQAGRARDARALKETAAFRARVQVFRGAPPEYGRARELLAEGRALLPLVSGTRHEPSFMEEMGFLESIPAPVVPGWVEVRREVDGFLARADFRGAVARIAAFLEGSPSAFDREAAGRYRRMAVAEAARKDFRRRFSEKELDRVRRERGRPGAMEWLREERSRYEGTDLAAEADRLIERLSAETAR